MADLKIKTIGDIIAVEGGYVNDPSDSGGETKFGITSQVARDNGYVGQMEYLPRETAFDIYAARYWDAIRGDSMVLLSEAVTAEVVDTGVNMGVKRASVFLQRALNVFNNRGHKYDDIVDDGVIGSGTLRALELYLKSNDEKTLVNALNCLQGAAYIELAERREKDEKFINGWFKNRVV